MPAGNRTCTLTLIVLLLTGCSCHGIGSRKNVAPRAVGLSKRYLIYFRYKVNPEVSYRYLRDEEAEAEYSRRHKTMNLFNVMVKRKMVDENTEEGAAEFKEANAQ